MLAGTGAVGACVAVGSWGVELGCCGLLLLLGADSRDDELRVWRGGASEWSLIAPSSSRRRCVRFRLVAEVGRIAWSGADCWGRGWQPGRLSLVAMGAMSVESSTGALSARLFIRITNFLRMAPVESGACGLGGARGPGSVRGGSFSHRE